MKRYIHSSSDLNKKYRGIWFGASKNPITVKELLDKVIDEDGRGFTVMRKIKQVSDNLLEDSSFEIYLLDEERRGKFKLTPDTLDYLMNNLSEDNWIREKLIEWEV